MNQDEAYQKAERLIGEARRSGATGLNLSDNRLTALPESLGQLTQLQSLNLMNNQLTVLPKSLDQLTQLKTLKLMYNQLMALPESLGHLTQLQSLNLSANQLASLPESLGQLTQLKTLNLMYNKLASLPESLGQLTQLQSLSLAGNQLTSLPESLGQLTQLQSLKVMSNQLTALPESLGQLTQLKRLELGDNPLTDPPQSVIAQGTASVLAYLRDKLEEGERPQWRSRMLLVGEGGVGKTQLLRRLKGEGFEAQSETTHGIDVRTLGLKHPTEPGVEMTLSCWDFGGQQIYHATHQFFLTGRSLFLLCWSARTGHEASKLDYWLDTIHSLAPDAPVMLIATHSDERDAKLPYDGLKKKYPQIAGQWTVSNLLNEGVEEVCESMRGIAAHLPMMGKALPNSWIDAAEKVRGLKQTDIPVTELFEIFQRNKVTDKESQESLATYLHDLGDITWFANDEELKDTVILDAQWLSNQVSAVLEHKAIIDGLGIFRREHMEEVWPDLPPVMCDRLLRLMERFDLSYRIPDDPENKSLVVERLNLDPPDYQMRWQRLRELYPDGEICLRFDFDGERPPGIPTWFIARSHRFTTHTHWRYGALFSDGNGQHLALIEANPGDRGAMLTVRGPSPYSFFAIMRDGFEVTLARFPGLRVTRTVPCPGHEGKPCDHRFNYDLLVRAYEKSVASVQCAVYFEQVELSRLLFGIHASTQNEVYHRLEDIGGEIVATEQKTFRAFISSTGIDLKEYREAAVNTCLGINIQPIAMEHFEAMGHGATAGSKRKMRDAHVYIGIFAHRYGYIESGNDASVTENEFNFADELGIERLCFLIDENHPWPPGFMDFENHLRLTEFKKKINSNLIRAKFTTVESFSFSLLKALIQWRERILEPGSSTDKRHERLDITEDMTLSSQARLSGELRALRQLTQLEFSKSFARDQRLEESHAPSVFSLRPKGSRTWAKDLAGQIWELRLWCEYPGGWHWNRDWPVYEIKEPAKWLAAVAPHLKRLLKVLRFVAPLAGPLTGYALGEYETLLKNDIALMKELIDGFKELQIDFDVPEGGAAGFEGGDRLDNSGLRAGKAEGDSLIELRRMLDANAPDWQTTCRLRKILTPENHYLWLCEEHRKEYLV